MNNKQQVYLIDSSIYVFRAWFTMPDTMLNNKNELVNAVYGFADFLIRLLEQEQPVYIACAFDQSLTTSLRNNIYPDYKANREPAPEELKKQFTYCRQLVKLLGIAEYASDSYEADDIIGTLSTNMRANGFSNIVITGDKDLTQLIRNDDLWWEYGKDKRMDYKGVFKNFGVTPEQIADLLALAGDKVDNIPGVPGVGLKTAANLLAKFDTLDNLLTNIADVGNMKFRGAKRIQRLLEEHHETARLSKKLTITAHDASLPTKPDSLKRQSIDYDALERFFDELGFGQLRRKRWHQVLNAA